MYSGEAGREAPLHPSQPGEARSGGSARTVALEQLPRVCLSGERSGRNKSVERAKAQDHRADKFPNVMRRTRPGLEPRETRGTRRWLIIARKKKSRLHSQTRATRRTNLHYRA